MKRNQWAKAVILVCSILTLAGCSHHKKPGQYAVDEANAAYGTRASGLGNEEGFYEGEAGGRSLQPKRTYYFDYDSSAIHEQDKPAVLANARYLATHSTAKVTVEGHTDPRGSREYNIALGERRARAVESMLMRHGAKHSQIRVVSYGAEKLASPGRSEADFQRDRRVVLHYRER